MAMKDMWAAPAFRAVLLLAAAAAALWLVYEARAVILPFAAAFCLAYLLDPVIDRMERLGLGRQTAIISLLLIVFLFAGAALFFLAPIAWGQALALGENVPRYIETLREKAAPLLESIPHADRESVEKALREGLGAAGGAPLRIAKGVAGWAWSGLSSVVGMASALLNLVVIPVATYYLLKDFDHIVEAAALRVPPRHREWAELFFGKIDTTLSAFFRGQLVVAAIMAAILSTGLFLIGTPMGLLIGLAAGLANIVPYLAVIVGLAPALLLTYLQFDGWSHPLMVLLLFAGAQALEGFVISPKVLEKALGLHPVAVIVALMAGGAFFGFAGILLAVPAAAVLRVAFEEVDGAYLKSRFYLGGPGEG